MRYLPESLFGRLLTALLAAIGATLVVIVALMLRERNDLLVSGSEATAIVNVLESTIKSVAALSGAERAAELERLHRDGLATGAVASMRRTPGGQEDPAKAARELKSRLERALGGDYRVTATPAVPDSTGAIRVGRFPRGLFFGPALKLEEGEEASEQRARSDEPFRGQPFTRAFDEGLFRDWLCGRVPVPGPGPGFGPQALDVGVTLPDGAELRFRTDVPSAPPPLPTLLLVELASVSLVLALALYVMARTITRPLADLAAAAEAVGRGTRFLPLRETGAREVRDATRAFNTMQERLSRYIDSRTRVVSAMSHDLRTPLTRLKLRVEGLDDEQLRDRFNADLDDMSRMVTGALDLFRGLNDDEAGQSVRIDALLGELREEFAELRRHISITGATEAPIQVRRDALKRCLTNLLSNAVKYGANVAVRIEEDDVDVIIRIQDDGPGVPEALLEHVFEPFFRVESSRNPATGGTGLGLSIARDVAQAHGGSLVLRNRVPQGLEAILRLPKTRRS